MVHRCINTARVRFTIVSGFDAIPPKTVVDAADNFITFVPKY